MSMKNKRMKSSRPSKAEKIASIFIEKFYVVPHRDLDEKIYEGTKDECLKYIHYNLPYNASIDLKHENGLFSDWVPSRKLNRSSNQSDWAGIIRI